MRRLLLIVFLVVLARVARPAQPGEALPQVSPPRTTPAEPAISLPSKPNAVRFAVIGDSGSGDHYQYEVAHEMEIARQEFPFNFVLMLGDNIVGGHSPRDFRRKFEQPYQGLLSAGVKFYASLGNHDQTSERLYKPFNMGGHRYYSFKRGNVTFFALDSNYMDPQQVSWLKEQLRSVGSGWKICFFHHPLYSNGRTHGPDMDLRHILEPIFDAGGVNVVFSGHDHIYERFKPQKGVYYFVEGNSGRLRYHNLRPSSQMATGFDTDRAFMLVEIAGNQFYFQTISRTGKTVDHGVLEKQNQKRSG